MTQADVYRAYAEACFRVARNSADEAERARWIGMAQHWLQWAQEVEVGETAPVPPDDKD